ncbi:hypothetical protein PAPYR_11448 [Paratrimastix pyriformis]|uniref:Uncharacterized protein n=1 Tax=Paratrimastix pyriformis TaxID=342808 RepID=A0ABQ8U3Q6_9EUKA|nr:hypothetical protein PAPYR_11448 [Paratrimastix pyriformis]
MSVLSAYNHSDSTRPAWLSKTDIIALVNGQCDSPVKMMRLVRDGDFKNGKPRFITEFMNPAGVIIYRCLTAKREFTQPDGRATAYFKFCPSNLMRLDAANKVECEGFD